MENLRPSSEELKELAKTWSRLIRVGRKVEPDNEGDDIGVNTMSKDQIETYVATMEAFGLSSGLMQQAVFDLYGPPKFRFFDHLGMLIGIDGKGDWAHCGDEIQQYWARKLLKHIAEKYIEFKSVNGLIQYLRDEDLYLTLDFM
jgi:hypothetical protein